MCQLWQIKENIKYNPFDDISISFNPLYVKENSHNKFTSFHWLICNAEWKFFNSFWLLKQNTFSQSCANSVTKSKRTLLKNGWSTPVECLNSLRTWRSRGHFKSKKDYYCGALSNLAIISLSTTLRLFAFKIELKSYVEAPHSHCVTFFLACGRECLAVGKKSLRGFWGKFTSDSGLIVRLQSDAMYRV